MIAYLFAFVTRWWRWRHPKALARPDLQTLAALSPQTLPLFVQESPAAQHYLALFGPLAWDQFPERPGVRL